MRNDSKQWDVPIHLPDAKIQGINLEITAVSIKRQTLISGPFNAALAAATLSNAVGWPEPACGESYGLRLRRDRILVVNGPTINDGWHDETGIGVSDMTAGYTVFNLAGSNAFSVLQRGTEITRDEPSGSVTRSFSGYPVLIHAYESATQFRLHIPSAKAQSLWQLLKVYANEVG